MTRDASSWCEGAQERFEVNGWVRSRESGGEARYQIYGTNR
jgi:hypothetical protein